MTQGVKVLDVELSRPLTDIAGLDGYRTLKALVRLHGRPLGYITLPLLEGYCTAAALHNAVAKTLGRPTISYLLSQRLGASLPPEGLPLDELMHASPPPRSELPLPLVTVAVCTRDRTGYLKSCLDALIQLDYSALDLLVIDNAPAGDASERLVHQYPNIRYVRESRPGLDWARNRAINEARGEIIAYTDDDGVVDPGWVTALADVFRENPLVMAVTGLVVPYELETRAQILFENYGGFGRGFERKWYRRDPAKGRKETFHIGAGRFGTGANMAYRRSLFENIDKFDTALDVGTVTNGGGDLEMFFRVLQEGYTLVYEPGAVVRHRHRRDYQRLHTQLANNGIGFYAYLVRSASAYPEMRFAIARFGLWWFWWWSVRRLLLSFIRPAAMPRDLIRAELFGVFAGLFRYPKARRAAAQIEQKYSQLESAEVEEEARAVATAK